MSAVLEAAPSSVGSTPARGRGVWAAAWRRLRQDRVGMFSLAAVVAFLVLIALTALHLVAADWQQERAVPSAPSSVPIAVATSAATSPTNTEVCVAFSVLLSTSRPSRSAPSGSVWALGLSTVR